MSDAFQDMAGSVIIGLGGLTTMSLSAIGSTDAARFVSEQIIVPLLGSVAPGFTF